ncbi:MAG: pyrrolysine--tRNA(Pyl) ligase small subunit [Promethearchaeota archaeon]
MTIKLAREKRPFLYELLQKTKLWISRRGTLHGVKHVTLAGSYLKIETFCNKSILTRNSRRSRSARWLRRGWADKICKTCEIPKWRLSKFSNKFI